MSIVNKITTFVIMTVAKAYCGTWYFARCRLFRRINDMDYHIFPIEPVDGVSFFSKVVEKNTMTEKTSSVKIGNVNIRYTFEKSAKASDIALLNEPSPEAVIATALVNYPKVKTNHNPTVVKINNYRKDRDVFTRQNSL